MEPVYEPERFQKALDDSDTAAEEYKAALSALGANPDDSATWEAVKVAEQRYKETQRTLMAMIKVEGRTDSALDAIREAGVKL